MTQIQTTVFYTSFSIPSHLNERGEVCISPCMQGRHPCFLVCVIMSSVCPPAWPTCDVRLQWLYASQERAEERALEMEAQMRALHLYVDSLEKLSSRLSPSPPPSDDDNFISGESPPIRMCKRRKFNHSSPQDKKKKHSKD